MFFTTGGVVEIRTNSKCFLTKTDSVELFLSFFLSFFLLVINPNSKPQGLRMPGGKQHREEALYVAARGHPKTQLVYYFFFFTLEIFGCGVEFFNG